MSLVLRHDGVHRIPRQRIVTIATRPSWRRGTARGSRDDLPDGQSEIFFAYGLDSGISVDLSREIEFSARLWQLRVIEFCYSKTAAKLVTVQACANFGFGTPVVL
jgi:hypothetical protein